MRAFFKGHLEGFGPVWGPKGSKRVPREHILELFGETSGNMKTVLSPTREHHFDGRASDGALCGHCFLAFVLGRLFSRFLWIWPSIGGDLGTHWDHFGMIFRCFFGGRFLGDFESYLGEGRRQWRGP